MKFSWDNFQIPADYELFEHLVYGSEDPSSQYINLAIPRGKVDFPTLVWFHGGGMSTALCDSNPAMWDGSFAVAAVRYRLAPGAMPPAQSVTCLRWQDSSLPKLLFVTYWRKYDCRFEIHLQGFDCAGLRL